MSPDPHFRKGKIFYKFDGVGGNLKWVCYACLGPCCSSRWFNPTLIHPCFPFPPALHDGEVEAEANGGVVGIVGAHEAGVSLQLVLVFPLFVVQKCFE